MTNTITYTEGEAFKVDNYTITKNEGKLKITAVKLPEDPDDPDDPANKRFTVTDPEDTVYNGQEQKQPVKVHDETTGRDLTEGTDFDASYTAAVDADTVTVTITGKGNYSGEFTRTYEIKKRVVDLSSPSDSKEYDGTPLTAPTVTGWEQSGDKGFVTGEVSDVKATGSVTTVAESPVTNTITYTEEKNFKASNYEITKAEGTLSITQAKLPDDPDNPDDPANERFTVTGPEDTMYNGQEQKQPVTVTDSKTNKDLVEGTDYDISYTPAVNAGTVTVTITGKGNYSGEFTRTYEITKRNVNLKSETAEKTYDGKPLTKPDVEVTGDGFVVGEAIAKATGTVTEVAEGVKTNAIEIEKGENYLDSNYNITKEEGTLKINPASIEPEDPDDPEDPANKRFNVTDPKDTQYNSEPQKQPVKITDTETKKDLVEGKDYTIAYTDKSGGDDLTNIGSKVVTITGIGNYSGTITREYNITPRTIKLISATDQKVYDGTPLTNHNVDVVGVDCDGDGLAKNDKDALEFDVTGSQTYVGSSANTFTYRWKDETEDTTTGALDTLKSYFVVYAADSKIGQNYIIQKEEGTLTVSDNGVDPGKVVTKTHEGKKYKVGDTITFTIKATNIYDENKTITLVEQEGVTLAQSVFENVAPGQTVQTTATYKVTEKDAKAGKFTNVVTTKFSGTTTEFQATDTVTDISGAGSKGHGPNTGDNGFGFDLTMMFGSAAAFLAMLFGRRRKEQE